MKNATRIERFSSEMLQPDASTIDLVRQSCFSRRDDVFIAGPKYIFSQSVTLPRSCIREFSLYNKDDQYQICTTEQVFIGTATWN